MTHHTQEILLYAQSLSLGANVRVICPACSGGSSSEKSLSITHCDDGTVRWQCFRDKCDLTDGSVSHQWRHPTGAALQTVKKKTQFEGRTESLKTSELEWIEDHWGIQKPPYWYYTPEMGGRIAMSIRSPKYEHRGWVLRDISGLARTKALTFVDEGEQALSWYKTKPEGGTIIVEDIPSAVRGSEFLNAVALCGTGIGIDRAIEIANTAPRPIYVALDNDATSTSFRYYKKFALLWDTVKVLPLAKDIKDLTYEEAKELLEDK